METDELELLAGQPLRLSFADILAHPRLPEARRAYLDSFLGVYDGDPFLVRLVLDAGRFFVFHFAAVLDAGQDLSRRETWFTVSALKQQLALYGFASGRQVDHLVRRLQGVGFMTEQRHPADGRVRLLAITQKLRRIIRTGSRHISLRLPCSIRTMTTAPSWRAIRGFTSFTAGPACRITLFRHA